MPKFYVKATQTFAFEDVVEAPDSDAVLSWVQNYQFDPHDYPCDVVDYKLEHVVKVDKTTKASLNLDTEGNPC